MESKDEIRKRVWRAMEERGVARFPGTQGRIPNFVGAERTALTIQALPLWQKARVIKANPDSPQRAIRELALAQGKIVYMAVPRLREERPFIELDPNRIRVSPSFASTIKGAFKYGHMLSLEKLRGIDLVICGSVAVNMEGARVGKGGGYSDLEFALLVEADKISESTPIVTTVHPFQVIDQEIEMKVHDIPIDWIVTPEGILDVKNAYQRPKGIYWDLLDPEKIGAIPVLREARR